MGPPPADPAPVLAAGPSPAVPVLAVLLAEHEPEVAEMARRYNASAAAPITPRPRAEVARFFDGLEMIGPGLVNLTDWWEAEEPDTGLAGYVGIGRKP